MAETDGETLESWLNKATNPCNREEDWEYIINFCDQVNKELEGPQIAVRLLAHKIQSPQEWESLQALTVLEACMKNCGRRFHNEVGKFRFLNELIKVVSPKYLGDRVSEKVKTKVIALLYSWTVALPEEIKIKDAYQMLKRQGIILSDPLIPLDHTLIPSPPARPKNPIFEDEERSKLLAKLLKSKNPDDLQEANKLIKSMVKEDEVRMQRVSKRIHTLEEVNNNVKLLQEMLTHYNKEESSEGDRELMKELFERCETKRLTLFKMASETEDNDSCLGDILQASDNLSRAISQYKKVVEHQDINGEIDLPDISERSCVDRDVPTLIDLGGCEAPSTPLDLPSIPAAPAQPQQLPPFIPTLPPPPLLPTQSCNRLLHNDNALSQMNSASSSLCLLDEELLFLGLDDSSANATLDGALNSKSDMVQEMHGGIRQNLPYAFAFPCPELLGLQGMPPASSSDGSGESSRASCDFNGKAFLTEIVELSKEAITGGKICTADCNITKFQDRKSKKAKYLSKVEKGELDILAGQPLISTPTPPLLAQSLQHMCPTSVTSFSTATSCSTFFTTASTGPSPVQTSSLPPGGIALHELEVLGQQLLEEAKVASAKPATSAGGFNFLSSSIPMKSTSSVGSVSATSSFSSLVVAPGSPILLSQQASPQKGSDISLANVNVPLELIKPSTILPVTAYDKNGFRILFHFAKDCPPNRPDTLVVVISMLNTAPLPIRNILMQAAVPKTMKVKLQPPSGTEMLAFNPIQPPAAVTQVMLVANPLKEKVRLRYKISFTLGEQNYTEVGEVDQFPEPDQWGKL